MDDDRMLHASQIHSSYLSKCQKPCFHMPPKTPPRVKGPPTPPETPPRVSAHCMTVFTFYTATVFSHYPPSSSEHCYKSLHPFRRALKKSLFSDHRLKWRREMRRCCYFGWRQRRCGAGVRRRNPLQIWGSTAPNIHMRSGSLAITVILFE